MSLSFFQGELGPVGDEGELGQLGIRVSQNPTPTPFALQVNVIHQCIFIALTDVSQTVSIIWKTDPRAVHSLAHTECLCLCSLNYSSNSLCLLLDIMTSGGSHETCHEFIRLVFHPKIKRNKSQISLLPSGKKFSYVIQTVKYLSVISVILQSDMLTCLYK